MNVIVSDSSGKVAFRGATNAEAAFSTANLAPGNYVVQFQSTSQALKGNQYLVVVAAGGKKVIADAVPGEKFHGGGVAMRVAVERGLRITGQVATDQVAAFVGSSKVKVIDGKRYVWVKARTGSNLPEHWEEEGLAAARFVATISNDKLRRIQGRFHSKAACLTATTAVRMRSGLTIKGFGSRPHPAGDHRVGCGFFFGTPLPQFERDCPISSTPPS